ncbi:hypothetical protein AVEN_78102-1 [Araneus ventricosus]|uniref:Uncharacterized protein n=1 Tax=Araneus ventricosus TaxID=182803 RepID=A0A4Y2F5D2_ARAVE|nr:hypothetical protein AVEN_78102-1 [Araneus ventricosus]
MIPWNPGNDCYVPMTSRKFPGRKNVRESRNPAIYPRHCSFSKPSLPFLALDTTPFFSLSGGVCFLYFLEEEIAATVVPIFSSALQDLLLCPPSQREVTPNIRKSL